MSRRRFTINTKELSDWVQYYTKDVKFYNNVNVKKIGYYYETYIKLLTHLMYMNNSDTIAIVSPNKTEILNREQFVDYIIKFKNSKLLNVKNINKFKEKF